MCYCALQPYEFHVEPGPILNPCLPSLFFAVVADPSGGTMFVVDPKKVSGSRIQLNN